MKRKSQNPNESNEIDSEKTSMNAHVSTDPNMHIFFVACSNYDTLIQKKASICTNCNTFIQF